MDGRELSVVFAKDRRKTADEMRPLSRQRGDSRERGGRDSRDRGRYRRWLTLKPIFLTPTYNFYDHSSSRSRSRERGGRSDRGGVRI